MDPNQQQQQQHQFNLPPGFNLQAANNLGRAPPQQAQQPSHLPTQQLSNPIPSIRGGVQRHGTQEVWSALQRMVEMGGQPNPQMLSQMSQLLSNNGIQTQGFPQQQQMQQFQNANNPQFQQAMSQQMQQQPFPGMPNMPQGMPNNMNVGGNHPQGSMQQQQNIAQMFQLGMGQQQGQGQQPQQQQQQQIPPQLMQAAQMQQNGFQMPMQQHMQQQPQQQQQQGQPADPHMAELLNEQQQQNGGLTQQMLKSLTANDIAALKGMNPAQRASYIGLRFANQPMPPQNAQSTSQQQPPPGLPQQMQQQAQMNNQFQQFMTPQQANRGMQQQAPQQQQQQQQPPNQPMPMPMPQQSQLQNQQNNEERIRLLNQQKAQAHQALVAAMNPASNMDPTVRMRLLAKFGQQPLQQQPQQQPPQQQQTQPPPPQAQQMQQPQQQIQQQQQQAMMQMLNQPGSGMPMPPIAMKPQQSQNMGGMLPGPPGGDSAAGPGPENVQLAQPMEDVSVPRLSAQLQKEHQEAQMLVRQWQQIQQLPQEQQQSPAAMQVKSALMNKQRRIQMISRLIKSKNEQRPSSGMPVNPPGPGDQNGGTPGMPMANNGLVPPNMAHAASQSPNQARTGPSPSVPQQPMGQPQAMSQMNVPQQPPPTVQAQQQFMLRNQLQPSNAGAQGQRLPQGSLNNSMNNPAFENQPNMAMAMNVPQQQRQQQQQQPPPPPPQQQMMGVINAQSKQPMQPQAAQVAQSATPQALQMQAQQHAQDMQRLQAPTPGLPQQQNPVNGQPMMQPNQRNVEANNNLLDYIVNAKTLTDAQVDHMRVLMPFWTEKDKFVPMARALRENLTRPCPKPEFIERWMRYARARHDILHKTFTFPGAELLKVDGADMNIYDFYTLLVGVRAFGKQVAASLDFYASAGIRVGVPPQPGQQRCSLNAAQTLKAFTDLALAPIHNQIVQDHEQSFLYSRMLASFYVTVNGVQQWRPDVPPPPASVENAAPRPSAPGGQPGGLSQPQQDELWFTVMTSSDEMLLKRGYTPDQIRRFREEVQRMPQNMKADINKRIHDIRSRQQMVQQNMIAQQGQGQPGQMTIQMPQNTQLQGLRNPPFAQPQAGVRPPTQSSPPNMTLASLQQGMNQFPVQPPANAAPPPGVAPTFQVRLPITDPAQAMAFVNNLVMDAKKQFPAQARTLQMPAEMEQKYWHLVGLAREIAGNFRHRLNRFVTTPQVNGNTVLSAAPRYLMLVDEQVAGRSKQPPQYYLDFQQLLETIKRMYLLDRFICVTALNTAAGPSPIRSTHWPSSQWLKTHGMDPKSRIVTPNEPDPEDEQPPSVLPQVPTPANSGQVPAARRGSKRSLGPDEGSAQPPSKRGRASGVAANPTPSPAMVVPTPGPSSTPHMDASQTPANVPTVSDTTRTPKSPEVNKGKGKAAKPRAPPKRKQTKSGIPSTAEIIVIDQTPKPAERGVKRARDNDVIVLDGAGEDEPTGKRAKLNNVEEKQPTGMVVASAPPEPPIPTQPAASLFLSTTRPEDISIQQALAEFNELRDHLRLSDEESANPADPVSMANGADASVGKPPNIFEDEVMEWIDWDFGDPDEPTPELEKVAQSSPETTDSNKKPLMPSAEAAIIAVTTDTQPPVDAQNVKWDWEKPVPAGRWAISDQPIIY